jgi:hypothetical protein
MQFLPLPWNDDDCVSGDRELAATKKRENFFNGHIIISNYDNPVTLVPISKKQDFYEVCML